MSRGTPRAHRPVRLGDPAQAAEPRRQLTVFAPTDQAFLDLTGKADAFASLGLPAVADVLAYHVALGRRTVSCT